MFEKFKSYYRLLKNMILQMNEAGYMTKNQWEQERIQKDIDKELKKS